MDDTQHQDKLHFQFWHIYLSILHFVAKKKQIWQKRWTNCFLPMVYTALQLSSDGSLMSILSLTTTNVKQITNNAYCGEKNFQKRWKITQLLFKASSLEALLSDVENKLLRCHWQPTMSNRLNCILWRKKAELTERLKNCTQPLFQASSLEALAFRCWEQIIEATVQEHAGW